MDNVTPVPAEAIRTGDMIELNGQINMVTFVALVRGVNIEIKFKPRGLQSRMAPEKSVIVYKRETINKVQ